MRTTILSLLFISLFGYIRAGPTCIRCTDAAEISECITNTAACGDNEQCYLEKVTKEDLSIRYNAGCRSTAVCQIMASLNAGRKKRDLVNCADCCADAPNENGPCNAALCGLKPQALQATCVVCNGIHSDVRSCTQAATCPPNEACFTGIRIVGTAIRYVFGCYEERVCKAMLDNDKTNSTINRQGRVIHGDQGIRICDACCKGDRCNAADCFDLKKKMAAQFTSTTPGAVVTTALPPPATT
nr:uncharacterized protein LOC105333981 isoform X1 [Crassostrea gigas]XP_034327327.1 uncharacterized protein LOC105333981 isoform X1 [Crassostrea gigas]XP_034327328.1 uncharacterized protein LOC105333981 isoform X1 [Crassostrea gigas]